MSSDDYEERLEGELEPDNQREKVAGKRDERLDIAVILITFIVIITAIGAFVYFSTPKAKDNSNNDNPPPPERLTIFMYNEANVEIHVWVYIDDSLAWEGYIGTGWLSSGELFYADSGGDITTRYSLSYLTWDVCYATVGDSVDITYHQDGTVSYFKY